MEGIEFFFSGHAKIRIIAEGENELGLLNQNILVSIVTISAFHGSVGYGFSGSRLKLLVSRHSGQICVDVGRERLF